MTDDAAIRYRAILKRAERENTSGLPHNVWAICRVIDETASFGYYDRNQYKERIDDLTSRLAALEGRK